MGDRFFEFTPNGTVSMGLLGAEINEGEPFELLKQRRLEIIERRILAIEARLADTAAK